MGSSLNHSSELFLAFCTWGEVFHLAPLEIVATYANRLEENDLSEFSRPEQAQPLSAIDSISIGLFQTQHPNIQSQGDSRCVMRG
jgi:hypothetical protein